MAHREPHRPASGVSGDSKPVGSGKVEPPAPPAFVDFRATAARHRTTTLEAFEGDPGEMERHKQFAARHFAQAITASSDPHRRLHCRADLVEAGGV